jgi:hypothetical protein
MSWQPLAAGRRTRALRSLFRSARQKDRPETRGLQLMRNWLSAEQRAQFDRFGYFDVRGSVSGKKYRIHFGVSANIQEIGDDGKAFCGWCFAPDRHLVPGDVMLAQKIALETSECTALAIANQFPPILPNGLRFAR